MKRVIMYSGGVGSFAEASLVVEEFGREEVLAVFNDVRMEDEDLYRFLHESIAVLGIEFLEVSDGRTPWEVFRDVKFLGNSRIDPCSRVLKRDLFGKWLRANYRPDDVEIHAGIDYSEVHRLGPISERNKPYRFRSLMCERRLMLSREEKIEWCRSRGVEPPRLTVLGFAHNNCGGFCVKAGLAHFRKLLEWNPERFQFHVERERASRGRSQGTPLPLKGGGWAEALSMVGGISG